VSRAQDKFKVQGVELTFCITHGSGGAIKKGAEEEEEEEGSIYPFSNIAVHPPPPEAVASGANNLRLVHSKGHQGERERVLLKGSKLALKQVLAPATPNPNLETRNPRLIQMTDVTPNICRATRHI